MTIGAVTSPTAPSSAASSLNLQDFMKILLTQLEYQDPLKPMDNQQFMAQIAQFTSLEQSQQINDKMTTLIDNQSALQSVGLIGRTVDYTTESGPLTGQVTAIDLSGSSPVMTVKATSGATSSVSLSQITGIR
jgi:flagellar basal-body rod modification protein FlgD